MKTNAIIRIIVWSLVIVLLVGALVVFLRPSPRFSERAVATSPLETTFPEKLPDLTEQIVTTAPVSGGTQTFDPAAVRELEIDWVAGQILIEPADVEVITVSETAVSDPGQVMVCRQRQNSLTIQFQEGDWGMRSLGIHTEIEKDLTIYVPRNWECHELEINAASATVAVNGLSIREMSLAGASGKCVITDCQVGELDIETASGDVTFSGTLNSLDFEAASATFTGELTNTPRQIDMESMSGRLDIALPVDCGYTVRMEGLNSQFHSEFDASAGRNSAYGDGRCRIDVEGLNAEVTIRKLGTN